MKALLEVCVGSPDDAFVAAEAGADRVELNRRLSEGGLTPSASAVRWVSSGLQVPLAVTVRPRADGFVYSRSEIQEMAREISSMVSAGAAAIVVGALTPGSMLDVIAMKELVAAASGAEVVFNRAFDLVGNRSIELERLVELGVARILTSGGAPTAAEGMPEIARLVQQSRERITVMPGGGVRASNVAGLLRATGCTQIHGSFSRKGPDGEPSVDGGEIVDARRAIESA